MSRLLKCLKNLGFSYRSVWLYLHCKHWY